MVMDFNTTPTCYKNCLLKNFFSTTFKLQQTNDYHVTLHVTIEIKKSTNLAVVACKMHLDICYFKINLRSINDYPDCSVRVEKDRERERWGEGESKGVCALFIHGFQTKGTNTYITPKHCIFS